MFARLALPSFTAIFTIAAFAVAASIFIAVAWRAVRMRRPDTDRLSRLPLETESPSRPHDPPSA
ncbi:MAG TPA: hypothetical protein VFE31_00910 [Opitutaceae bacterium]|jgi:hypothetical protein|nr:hypothetical protein [Opitutaceae bacterium]